MTFPQGRSLDVERAGHDAVEDRVQYPLDDSFHRPEHFDQIERERRWRQVGRRRHVAAIELERPPLGGGPEPQGDLLDLLIFEQPPHQLGTRIVPAVFLTPDQIQLFTVKLMLQGPSAMNSYLIR